MWSDTFPYSSSWFSSPLYVSMFSLWNSYSSVVCLCSRLGASGWQFYLSEKHFNIFSYSCMSLSLSSQSRAISPFSSWTVVQRSTLRFCVSSPSYTQTSGLPSWNVVGHVPLMKPSGKFLVRLILNLANFLLHIIKNYYFLPRGLSFGNLSPL